MVRIFPQRRSPTALRRASEGESIRTVLIALAANIVIAIAKLIAGLTAHSTGMLAEAAHSTADSINEVLLAISLHRESKPADEVHPLGHSGERFLWAFLAAIGSFLIGGCVSVGMALHEFQTRHPVERSIAAWIVLAIAFLADGTSFVQSIRQAKRQAAEYGVGVVAYLRRASDPIVRAIVFEDGVALVGVALAAAGLFLSRMTGSNLPDSIASLLIGILLAITAIGLARPLADFLVGRSMPPEQVHDLRVMIQCDAAVAELVSLRALYSGPEEVLVMAKVRPSPHLSIDELARAMDTLDAQIRAALPIVADIFIDVTATHAPR
jgi:cation diffusion facilitator family transporter